MHYSIRAGREYGKVAEQWQRIADEARLHLSQTKVEPFVVDIAGFLHSGMTGDVIRVTFEHLPQAQRPRGAEEDRHRAQTEKVDFDPSDPEPAKQLLGDLWRCDEYYLTHCPDPARCSRHRDLHAAHEAPVNDPRKPHPFVMAVTVDQEPGVCQVCRLSPFAERHHTL